MFISDNWKDYELIDASDGERLERWGEYILIRPDPQVIWHGAKSSPLWKRADASYKRSSKGGGAWQESRVPESWMIGYRDLTFLIKPMGFKHTGIFPEQAAARSGIAAFSPGDGRRRAIGTFSSRIARNRRITLPRRNFSAAAASSGKDFCFFCNYRLTSPL